MLSEARHVPPNDSWFGAWLNSIGILIWLSEKLPCIFVFVIFNYAKACCKQPLQCPVPSLTFWCILSPVRELWVPVGEAAQGAHSFARPAPAASLRSGRRADTQSGRYGLVCGKYGRSGKASDLPFLHPRWIRSGCFTPCPAKTLFIQTLISARRGPMAKWVPAFTKQWQVTYVYLNDGSWASFIHNDVFPYLGKIPGKPQSIYYHVTLSVTWHGQHLKHTSSVSCEVYKPSSESSGYCEVSTHSLWVHESRDWFIGKINKIQWEFCPKPWNIKCLLCSNKMNQANKMCA